MAEIKYSEISRAKIADTRNAVISECSKGGFTLAQQLEVREGDGKTVVFLKGALHIDSIEGLHELRDAINVAIMKVEGPKDFENDDEWED
jgi:hypothetical protein